MKVILLRDVAKMGKQGSVVEVPDGFARNKLIPSGMAEPASKANMKRIEKQQASREASHSAATAKFKEVLASLENETIEVATELNEQDHAFKAISENDIVEAAKSKGINIDSTMIKINDPIKTAGEHEIGLEVLEESGAFKINVVKK